MVFCICECTQIIPHGYGAGAVYSHAQASNCGVGVQVSVCVVCGFDCEQHTRQCTRLCVPNKHVDYLIVEGPVEHPRTCVHDPRN